ncbi:MAG: acetolactate synthase large subunit [Burkholderiaceae bacterium]
MNGAESLVRTLVDAKVDVCFTNPGTSEMHFVAALDRVPGMRCVLGLFEGVATGAADGYYRMAERPAATLLHLGPGLANGMANLHNAKKAFSGIVNIVGDHAVEHLKHNAPLTSDLDTVCAPMSDVVIRSNSSRDIAADGARAVTAARTAPGQIATLILPADTAWNESDGPVRAEEPAPRPAVDAGAIATAAKALRSGRKGALLLGGVGLRGEGLELAGRIAAKTGCSLFAEGLVARLERGAGRVKVTRLPYPVDQARALLEPYGELILVGTQPPVSFFAYPDKPSVTTPPDCRINRLAEIGEDIVGALRALAEAVDALGTAPADVAPLARPEVPTGALNLENIGYALAALLPEQAIVVDEAVTSGRGFPVPTATAAPHDWLSSRGGSIGFGLPCAVGAAIACPDRKVVCLEGDGSGMYTVQSLWTMARESLDILVVVFANRGYQILRGELTGVGVTEPGPNALRMLTVDQPVIDWAALARAQGVEATRVSDLASLVDALRSGLSSKGPRLVEVVL